jgi:hypothetical protein
MTKREALAAHASVVDDHVVWLTMTVALPELGRVIVKLPER